MYVARSVTKHCTAAAAGACGGRVALGSTVSPPAGVAATAAALAGTAGAASAT
jgi:hypothetical protein